MCGWSAARTALVILVVVTVAMFALAAQPAQANDMTPVLTAIQQMFAQATVSEGMWGTGETVGLGIAGSIPLTSIQRACADVPILSWFTDDLQLYGIWPGFTVTDGHTSVASALAIRLGVLGVQGHVQSLDVTLACAYNPTRFGQTDEGETLDKWYQKVWPHGVWLSVSKRL